MTIEEKKNQLFALLEAYRTIRDSVKIFREEDYNRFVECFGKDSIDAMCLATAYTDVMQYVIANIEKTDIQLQEIYKQEIQ